MRIWPPFGSGDASTRAPLTTELVPLDTRVQSLLLLRVAMAGIVVFGKVLAPGIVTGAASSLFIASAAYLGVTLGAELLRRMFSRALELLTLTLLLDGVYVAQVVATSGGEQSALRSLIIVHIVAVTLLVSYRTGLKVAAWHILLLAAVQEVRGADQGDAGRTVVFAIAVLLVGACVATFSAVNERELRRQRADLEALHLFAVALDDARHAADVAQVLSEHAASVLGLGPRLVFGYRLGEATVLAIDGELGAVSLGDSAIVGPNSAVGQAWSSRACVLVRKLDPEVDTWVSRAFGDAENLIVVPLFTDGHPAGALIGSFEQVRHGRVARTVVVTAEQLAAHASLALRNAWLLHDVEELAVTDGLTRLSNRRHLEGSLELAVGKAKSEGSSVGFILVDLDRFKSLNDTYGHLTGDDVLRRVGDLLLAEAKPGDTVARYGGEEFAIVLPGRQDEEATVTAERIRAAIQAMEGPVPVTASFGVACYPSDAIDIDSLVLAADEALYESKRTGRNRVTAAARRATGWLDLPWRADGWEEDPASHSRAQLELPS